VGWRRTRGRSPEAQAVFDRALEELQSGTVNGAIALLRRALQLAPGDAEIAQALGKLAFKDRPGT
jgi:Flp pilus assembly protein TadD